MEPVRSVARRMGKLRYEIEIEYSVFRLKGWAFGPAFSFDYSHVARKNST